MAPRPIVGHPIPLAINLLDAGLLTDSDLSDARRVADRYAQEVVLNGAPPDSTLECHIEPLAYRIADGNVVSEHLPRLRELYEAVLPALVRTYAGLEIVPSQFPASGITLNVVEGTGGRYELHVDSNSVTGLLFACDFELGDGGELRLYYPDRQPLDILPKAGLFLLYDARFVPHEVLPLARDKFRLSLPMNYFLPTDVEQRPDRLDEYIFGSS
jgi:2OG-Fe(II) oxygenase superfamily